MAKHHSLEEKRAAIELRKAGVPLKMIRDQLKMNLRTIQRLFAAAKQPSFEDGGLPVPAQLGRVDAQEDPGSPGERWQRH